MIIFQLLLFKFSYTTMQVILLHSFIPIQLFYSQCIAANNAGGSTLNSANNSTLAHEFQSRIFLLSLNFVFHVYLAINQLAFLCSLKVSDFSIQCNFALLLQQQLQFNYSLDLRNRIRCAANFYCLCDYVSILLRKSYAGTSLVMQITQNSRK